MIDENHELFTADQLAIVGRIESRLAAGLGLSRLCLETGVKQKHIEDVLGRKPLTQYGHVIDYTDTVNALGQWLDATSDAHDVLVPRAETPSFKSITGILKIAHQSRTMVGITGPVGFGKSFAAACYAADNPRSLKYPGAVRIQFNKTDSKPAAALAAILEGLHGESIGAYRNGDLFKAIGAKLRPGDFLILDECQRLDTALDVVASLYDDFGVGIAMIGNPDFSNAIWGKNRTFDALGSRILRHEFTNTTAEDIEAWLAWKGVLAGLPIRERTALVKAAIGIGTRPGREGGLRTLNQVIDYARSSYPNQALTAQFISHLVKTLKAAT